MPKRRNRAMVRRRRKRGSGFFSSFANFLKRSNRYLRKTKGISKFANILAAEGVPYAGKIGQVAGKLGYGARRGRGKSKRKIKIRRRRGRPCKSGSGYRLAGAGFRLAGAGMYPKNYRPRRVDGF